MLRARLATAAVAIPTLLLLILAPSPWPTTVLILVVGVLGLAEYARMAFPTQQAQQALTVILGTLLMASAAFQPPELLPGMLALVFSAGLVFVLMARSDFEAGLRDLGLSLIGILYVGLLLPYFIWLRNADPLGPRWVIFVIAIGRGGDSGGYFVGHSLGRHKLMPRVSPGKTVEGALGIIVASLAAGALAKIVLLRDRSWNEILFLSLIMAVLGQLGDLCESVMKRTFGAKESGSLFPGHGGVLDRVDSLLFPLVFLYYHVVFAR